jgi:hypothetical protein
MNPEQMRLPLWIIFVLVACSGGSSSAPPPGGGESIERPAPPPDAAPAPAADAGAAPAASPGCTPPCTPTQYCIEMTVTGGRAPPRGQPAPVTTNRYCSDQLPASGAVTCTPPDGDRVVRCRGYAP